MSDQNKVRIIGGNWRGSKLRFADVQGLRPTGDRLRETLFNWLSPHLYGAHCLDLFAGSGCLSIEALSRGAKRAIAIDANATVCTTLRRESERLTVDNLTVIKADAITWLARAAEQHDSCDEEPPFDIVFVDPPFAASLHEACINALQQAITAGLIASNALIYIESPGRGCDFPIPESWQLLKQKQAGAVTATLYQRQVE